MDRIFVVDNNDGVVRLMHDGKSSPYSDLDALFGRFFLSVDRQTSF